MDSLVVGGVAGWAALLIAGGALCRAAAAGDRQDREAMQHYEETTQLRAGDLRRSRLRRRRGAAH
jgi:hypothetical protein